MVHLTDAAGSFHARVIAARLETEGIRTELRGLDDWPWPATGAVAIFVGEDDLDIAAEVLLYDRVEAVFLGEKRF